jgi:hypothetical protein
LQASSAGGRRSKPWRQQPTDPARPAGLPARPPPPAKHTPTPYLRRRARRLGQLAAVDVEGVPPAVHALLEGGALRADSPVQYAGREQLLAAVPSRQESYVRVPRINTASSSGAAPRCRLLGRGRAEHAHAAPCRCGHSCAWPRAPGPFAAPPPTLRSSHRQRTTAHIPHPHRSLHRSAGSRCPWRGGGPVAAAGAGHPRGARDQLREAPGR